MLRSRNCVFNFCLRYLPFFAVVALLQLEISKTNATNVQQQTRQYAPSEPQQIHLSLGRDHSEMVVTWTTYNETDCASVRYGVTPDGAVQFAVGQTTLFVDGGSQRRRHYIHRVALRDLKPFTRYQYRCGCEPNWSASIQFRTLSNDAAGWSPRVLLYGDLGLEGGVSIPAIRAHVERDDVDLIMHVGDFAYDLDSNNSHIGDEFMRTMEPIASRLPYQTSPGNHEFKYNFSNYNNRFSMFDMTAISAHDDQSITSSMNNHFYAFHLGPALFISFSTEFYYFVEYGVAQMYRQYLWLQTILRAANRPEARARHPWIITLGHRPMYCTDDDGDDCTRHNSIIRKGIPFFHTLGLEDLFYTEGVDLEIWAHEHSYERLWPLYDFEVRNGSFAEPYTNPTAPVHIITGSAGCSERLDSFGPPRSWSAFRLSEYGYTRMRIVNATHLTLEQVSDDRNGTIVDSITLVQHRHGTRSLPARPSNRRPNRTRPNSAHSQHHH